MAYLRMLWLYYETEEPLPNNTRVIGMKIGADPSEVELILEVFFKQDGDVWRNTRCDKEIAEYRSIRERNRTNGKSGGRPKKTQSVSSGNPVATEWDASRNPDESESEPTGNPMETLTNNHKPYISTSEDVDGRERGSTPVCPHQEILALWAEKLPSAIQPREWTPARSQALKARWREKRNRQDLEWWAKFFDYVGQSDFLMGRSSSGSRRPFELSIDWLLKQENFVKVIEGRYHEAAEQGARA